MTDKIIDLKQGEQDGKMIFTLVSDKWRCASYERRKAEDDNKRIEIEQKGKNRI